MSDNLSILNNELQKSFNKQQCFKIVIVGDPGVGKSCLLLRYIKQQFLSDYSATIGVEFQSKEVEIENNNKVKMQIWDTAGMESFHSIVTTFYRSSHAIIIVFNLSRKESFQRVERWHKDAKENAFPNAITILVGTQLDRIKERQVTKEDADNLQKQLNIDLYFETSALNGENVELLFKECAKILYSRFNKQVHLFQSESFDLKGNGQQQHQSDEKIEKDGDCC